MNFPGYLCCLIPALAVALLLLALVTWMKVAEVTARHPLHWLRVKMRRGNSVRELARRLDMPEPELRALQAHYSSRMIPKRRKGRQAAMRKLLVPDPATKAMQRRLMRRVLARLNSHAAATGFQRGTSIVHNAMVHVGQSVVIRMDVVDFFPSTTSQRVEAYFRRVGWNAEAAALLTKLTTHEGGLPQGAPTSPRLCNLVNFGLDAHIDRFVARRKGVYTRYADDITISFPKDYPIRVRGTIQRVKRILKANGYRAHVRGKLRILRRHQRQKVTGLVVNDVVNLPRETRRRLRAVEHHLATRRPATMSHAQLAGWKSLLRMIRQQRTPSHKTDASSPAAHHGRASAH
jgi:retron-type reverse transcriptase